MPVGGDSHTEKIIDYLFNFEDLPSTPYNLLNLVQSPIVVGFQVPPASHTALVAGSSK